MKMMKFILISIILSASLCIAQFGESQNVRAELISEVESIKPGEKIWIALKLDMAPEWHTYWRNPGDAGLPTQIDWSLPEDFTVSDIYWPHPEIFDAGGVVSYGYKNEILLLCELMSPADLSGDNIAIEAEATWLECKEMCLPGSAELSLILPVKNEPSEYDSRWKESFVKSRSMLPNRNYSWTFKSIHTDSSIIIESFSSDRKIGNPEKVQFLPYDEGIYSNSKPQLFRNTDAGFKIETMFADFKVGNPETISGLLKIENSGGISTQTVEIALPIESN